MAMYKRNKIGKRYRKKELIPFVVLSVFSVLTIGPLIWLITLSMKTQKGFVADPFGFPTKIYLLNYLEVITDTRMLRFILNSIVVTCTSVILVLIAILPW